MKFLPYLRIPRVRVYGAPLFVHWSAFFVGTLMVFVARSSLANALAAAVSYYAMLLLHEAGHAWFVKRERLDRLAVRITAFHGECVYEAPDYAEQDYRIAWGGMLAQLAVAVPLILADAIFGISRIEPFGAVVAILGYVSVAIAAFNLVPVEGLDGSMSWKLIKLWKAERRGRKFRPGRRR